jgi:hypothetical protein
MNLWRAKALLSALGGNLYVQRERKTIQSNTVASK